MKARGFTPPAEGQTAAPQNAGRGQPAASAAQGSTATTFDALFGPLTQTETFGQVWLNNGGKLQRVRLRLGITDGQQTELIQATDGELREDTEVVTNVMTGAVRQAVTPQGRGGFPGLGGGRQGGFPGGGRRGGG
jgi:hypothetical protein